MATTVPVMQPTVPAPGPDQARWWWVDLATGSLWLLFGFAILNGREEVTTVWTVAVLAGLLFAAFAVTELAAAIFEEGWRWLHVVLAVASALAAVLAFVWPGHTFLTLASIISWYLLITGVVHIAQAYGVKHDEDQWWAGVLLGVAEVLLAFWAIGYPGRSITLLLVWVSATALARGLLQVIRAFSLRSARRSAA